jgi:hypothetical protein
MRIAGPMTEYWYSRWLFERSLAATYLIAFFAAATQFVPWLGQQVLEVHRAFLKDVSEIVMKIDVRMATPGVGVATVSSNLGPYTSDLSFARGRPRTSVPVPVDRSENAK